MILEIQVELCRAGGDRGEIGARETAWKKLGDILVARLSPAPHIWGTRVKKGWLITYLNPEGMDITLINGLRTFPCAVYSDILDADGQPIMISPSGYRVPLNLFEGSPGLDENDITSEPVKPNGLDFLTKGHLIHDPNSRL